MNANIFGKEANDKPENPFEDMTADVNKRTPLSKVSPDMRSPDTLAQKPDSFFQPGDAGITDPDHAGPRKMMPPPGGTLGGINDYGDSLSSGMQFSREGNAEYAGKEARGKVLKAAKTSTGPIYEGQ